jgi:hypothetical protein
VKLKDTKARTIKICGYKYSAVGLRTHGTVLPLLHKIYGVLLTIKLRETLPIWTTLSLLMFLSLPQIP